MYAANHHVTATHLAVDILVAIVISGGFRISEKVECSYSKCAKHFGVPCPVFINCSSHACR